MVFTWWFSNAGLFRAAIGQSATSLSAWAYQLDSPKVTQRLAAVINPEFESKKPTSAQLLTYLKSLPAKTIDSASFKLSLNVSYQKSTLEFKLIYWCKYSKENYKTSYFIYIIYVNDPDYIFISLFQRWPKFYSMYSTL